MTKKLPPLVIHPIRSQTLALLTVCAALIAAPLVAVLFFRGEIEQARLLSLRLYAAVWIGVGVFLLLGCAGLGFNLFRLVSPRPVLAIRADGIEPLWFGLLEWEEIDRLARVRHEGQWLLGIFPKDVEEILARQTPFNRGLIRRAVGQGFPPLYVTQMALPVPIDELLDEIRRYTDVPCDG